MKIAIPSYNRPECLTIKSLEKHGIDLDNIYLFVANEEQEELYRKNLDNKIKIIIGIKGLCNIRNFITNYFDEGEILICMDDDIKDFVILEKPLLQVLNDSISYLEKSPYQLIGFPPTSNPFYIKKKGYTDGIFFCIGVLWMVKNDKSIIVDNILEDVERTFLSVDKYGGVIRCHDIMYKTRFCAKNGLEKERKELGYEKYYQDFVKLQYKYSQYCISKIKITQAFICPFDYPNPHFGIKKNASPIIKLPKIDPRIFEPLLNMLEKISLKRCKAYIDGEKNNGNYRKNFPQHESIVYGYIINRPAIMKKWGKEKMDLSRFTKKKPLIWDELKRIGDIFVPFPYSSCYICHNTVAGKHLDNSNVGMSCIVSIGNYEGCNLVIGNKKYDAHYQPIIFDGSKIEHWNTDDLVGNKYSLIYYNLFK